MAGSNPAQIDSNQALIFAFDPDTNSFRTTGGGGSAGAPETTVVLQDDNGSFLRSLLFAADGSVDTVVDTELDGTTPYVASGAVTPYFKRFNYSSPPVFNDYATDPVTTADYVELVAALDNEVNRVEVSNTCASTLAFGAGDEGAESLLFYITPGGNGPVDVNLPAGTRIAVKAVDVDAETGALILNFYV